MPVNQICLVCHKIIKTTKALNRIGIIKTHLEKEHKIKNPFKNIHYKIEIL